MAKRKNMCATRHDSPVLPIGDILDATGVPTKPADLRDERRAQLPRVNVASLQAPTGGNQNTQNTRLCYVAPQLAGRSRTPTSFFLREDSARRRG